MKTALMKTALMKTALMKTALMKTALINAALINAALINAVLMSVSGGWVSPALASGELPLQRFAAEVEAAYPATPTLTVQSFSARADRPRMLIVDARLPAERAVSQIPGAISSEQLRERLNESPVSLADSGRLRLMPTVLVYCTIGMRSAELTRELRSEGITAFNLSGGVLAWAEAGQPFVDSNGNPTRKVHVYGRRWNYLPDGYEAVW